MGLGADKSLSKPLAASLMKLVIPLAKQTTLEYNMLLGALQKLNLMDEFWSQVDTMKHKQIR